MLKTTSYFRISCFILGWVLLFNACRLKIYEPTSFGNMAVTLSGILPQCHSTVNGSQVITYSGSIQVFYYDSRGGNRRPGNLVNFTSGANPGNPVVVNTSVPSDGSHYELEIMIDGTQCSTCALPQFGPDNCIQSNVSNGRKAAKPRLDVLTSLFIRYQTTYSLNLSGQPLAPNVAGSCGCIVPN